MNSLKQGFRLIRETITFLSNNKMVLLDHIKSIAPYFLVASCALHFANAYKIEWLQFAMILPMTYLMSSFFLSWHRACLKGMDTPPYKPYQMDNGSFLFHLMFFAIFIVWGAVNQAIGYLGQEMGPEPTMAVSIGMIAVSIVAWVVFVKTLFFLPAQSVGVTMGLSDILRASKGGTIPFVITSLFFLIASAIAIAIYVILNTIIAQFAFGEARITVNTVAIASFILALPVYAILFLTLAAEITALSTLYQRGMENNA